MKDRKAKLCADINKAALKAFMGCADAGLVPGIKGKPEAIAAYQAQVAADPRNKLKSDAV
jgi:hypothetical protein